jgi:hypothetical protein
LPHPPVLQVELCGPEYFRHLFPRSILHAGRIAFELTQGREFALRWADELPKVE